MKTLVVMILALFSVSCSIYKSEWDCPPGEGVRCKPVSEVMNMIVEEDEGTDYFVKDPQQAALLRAKSKKKKQPKILRPESVIVEDNKTLYLKKKPTGDAVIVEGKS